MKHLFGEALSKMLKCSDIQIVEKAGEKIGQVVAKKERRKSVTVVKQV